jgi:hypothetical protein
VRRRLGRAAAARPPTRAASRNTAQKTLHGELRKSASKERGSDEECEATLKYATLRLSYARETLRVTAETL